MFLGRLHPMVLHLPIGFLLLAFVFNFLSRYEKFSDLGKSTGFTLLLGIISSVITALFGYFLSLEGGYSSGALNIHMWLGYLTVVVSVVVYLLHKKTKNQPGVHHIGHAFFSLLIIVLLLTGHYGGALTHGEDYLTYYLPDGIKGLIGAELRAYNKKQIEDLDSALVFDDLIMPVLDEKCVSCHGSSKVKGELRLDFKEGLLKGGESGKLYSPGDPENSMLIENINLPEDDEDHMPPEGKKQLTSREKKLLHWWVSSGASFGITVAQTEKNEEIQEIMNEIREEISKVSNPVYSMEMDGVAVEELTKLKTKGAKAFLIAQNSPLLQVKIDSLSTRPDQLLADVSDQVSWLDLSGSNCNDGHLQNIDLLQNVTKLYLQKTQVTDASLSTIAKLKYLEYLNLYGTEVSDNGIKELRGLEHLKTVYLWKTGVTEDGAASLKEEMPNLKIDLGKDYPSVDTTAIGAVVSSSDAP